MLHDKKVGELVTENIKTAHVFKKHGIDFCCGGGISIAKACKVNNVNQDELLADLEGVGQNSDRTLNYDSWDTGFLVQHIENVHHTYVKEATPMILEYAAKVDSVHGHAYPELKQIHLLFQGLAADLLMHLKKEEHVLFPAVRELIERKGPAGMIMHPVAIMEREHEIAGDMMSKIRTLSNDYTPPKEACNTYKALYSKLQEYEEDLHLHVHLENNILFNRLRQMQ
jgi:regulator of cell morphogenesis and NO signaling